MNEILFLIKYFCPLPHFIRWTEKSLIKTTFDWYLLLKFLAIFYDLRSCIFFHVHIYKYVFLFIHAGGPKLSSNYFEFSSHVALTVSFFIFALLSSSTGWNSFGVCHWKTVKIYMFEYIHLFCKNNNDKDNNSNNKK